MSRALCRRFPTAARRIAAGITATLVWGPELLAQAPGAPAVPGTPPGGAAPAPAMTRPLFMEWVIVAAMIGLAVFVVCKSSRRN